jgi:alkanesulfonate monooxygenase SsuD/methylene tetrahydromethanopterin reductase-like flavin-dependent oxidoreductase (luciferase family)
LFLEKLELLLKIRASERVTWSGRFRPAITDRGIYPRPLQDPLPVWIGVGGTPQSAARAGKLGLPMAIAIIGGTPDRFVSFAHLYRVSAQEAGHDLAALPLGINSPGYIADTSQQAGDEYFPAFSAVMNDIGRERGWAGMGRHEFDQLRGPHAAIVAGSPQQVIDKLLYEHSLFKYSRFMLQISLGPLPHAKAMRAIELFGTQVAPAVRAALAG